MGRSAAAVVLAPAERAELEAVVRTPSSPQQAVSRARIVLRAAEGASNRQIATEVGMSELRVGGWRTKFIAEGIAGLVGSPPLGPPAHDRRGHRAARDRQDPGATAGRGEPLVDRPPGARHRGERHERRADLAPSIACGPIRPEPSSTRPTPSLRPR